MEGKAGLLSMKMVILWVAVMVAVVVGVEGLGCPSTGQLAGACGQYVVGQNPPVPPATGGCCSLLKSSSASCLCSVMRANVRSLVSPKGLSNIRTSCKIGSMSCPGS